MKLIIIANPNISSFSFKILEVLVKQFKKQKERCEIIDLYRDKHKQDFYNHLQDSNTKYFQRKILKSDEIIFIHPIYWCSPPAILKNFIEQNFREGFAYKYSDNNEYVPLLSGKKLHLIVTSNETEQVYKDIGMPFKTAWDEFALGTGMKLERLIHIGNMRSNQEERKTILESLEKLFA